MLGREGEEHLLKVRVLSEDVQLWTVGDHEVRAERIAGRWKLDGHIAPPVSVAGDGVTVFDADGLALEAVDPRARAARAPGDRQSS